MLTPLEIAERIALWRAGDRSDSDVISIPMPILLSK